MGTREARGEEGTHGDALDVVAQHLAVALGAALAQTLTTLATARHCYLLVLRKFALQVGPGPVFRRDELEKKKTEAKRVKKLSQRAKK